MLSGFVILVALSVQSDLAGILKRDITVSPCSAVQKDSIVALVQDSPQFEIALEGIRTRWFPDSTIPTDVLLRICSDTKVISPSSLSSAKIAYFYAGPGYVATFGVFAIFNGRVTLLNPLDGGTLGTGFDPAKWNSFIRTYRFGEGNKPTWVLAYACLLRTLRRGDFPLYECERGTSFSLERTLRKTWKVVFAPNGGDAIEISDDLTIELQ